MVKWAFRPVVNVEIPDVKNLEVKWQGSVIKSLVLSKPSVYSVDHTILPKCESKLGL